MLVMLHMDKLAEFASLESQLPPIDWCTRNSGNASDHVIVINDCAQVINEILPQFGFPVISIESFVRKMYRWGFKQVSVVYADAYRQSSHTIHTSYMYESEHFRKDDLFMLGRMSFTAEKCRRSGTEQTKSAPKRPIMELPSGNDQTKRIRMSSHNLTTSHDNTLKKQGVNGDPVNTTNQLTSLVAGKSPPQEHRNLLQQTNELLSEWQSIERSILLTQIEVLALANRKQQCVQLSYQQALQFPPGMELCAHAARAVPLTKIQTTGQFPMTSRGMAPSASPPVENCGVLTLACTSPNLRLINVHTLPFVASNPSYRKNCLPPISRQGTQNNFPINSLPAPSVDPRRLQRGAEAQYSQTPRFALTVTSPTMADPTPTNRLSLARSTPPEGLLQCQLRHIQMTRQAACTSRAFCLK
jgi:HSF-type DNA-binding